MMTSLGSVTTRSMLVGAYVVVTTSIFASSALSGWLPDGTPVCVAQGIQFSPIAIADGNGGAVLCWTDLRSGAADIYAQRLNASGAPLWPADGVPICVSPGAQYSVVITSDGEEGAILVWTDERSGSQADIYSQRIMGSGAIVWEENGVSVCIASGVQSVPTVTCDGAGGAIVAWQDERAGAGSDDVYVQRIDASGSARWLNNGVPVCTAAFNQGGPNIIADSFGGTIIVWRDVRSGDVDLFAQRIDEMGNVCWGVDGVAVCSVAGYQFGPSIVTDDAGGAIVTWMDWRPGFHSDVYAQRVYSTGLMAWSNGGVPVCVTIHDQFTPVLIADGVGGAIAVWDDTRNGNSGVFAQRISAAGNMLWAPNGTSVCDVGGDQYARSVVTDHAGGAIVAWEHGSIANADIYAGRITSSGEIAWTPGGVPICTATGEQSYTRLVSDGVGGAIASWVDERNGDPSNKDIYALRLDPDGGIPTSVREPVRAPFTVLHSSPNPFSTRTTIQFELNVTSTVELKIFDVRGRRVRSLFYGLATAGLHEVQFTGHDDHGRNLPSGVYFCRLITPAGSVTQKLSIAR